MDVGGMLKNPVVWGGGLLLGVVLMMRANPATAQSSQMSSSVAANAAIMGANIDIAKVNAQLGVDQINSDLQKQLGFYAYLSNVDNNQAMVENTRVVSQAGIANALIQSSTAIIVDQSNNAARLGMAEETTAQAQIQADASVNVARYQAQAQEAASKNNMIGQIAGAVAGIAKVALGGL